MSAESAPAADSAAVAGVGALSENLGRSGGWATFAPAVVAFRVRTAVGAPGNGDRDRKSVV